MRSTDLRTPCLWGAADPAGWICLQCGIIRGSGYAIGGTSLTRFMR